MRKQNNFNDGGLKNFYGLYKAFSLAETIIILMVISTVLAATAPLITKRIVNNAQAGLGTGGAGHGRYECYYNKSNVLHEKYCSGTKCTDKTVSNCKFRPPYGTKDYVIYGVAGGGAGGGYKERDDLFKYDEAYGSINLQDLSTTVTLPYYNTTVSSVSGVDLKSLNFPIMNKIPRSGQTPQTTSSTWFDFSTFTNKFDEKDKTFNKYKTGGTRNHFEIASVAQGGAGGKAGDYILKAKCDADWFRNCHLKSDSKECASSSNCKFNCVCPDDKDISSCLTEVAKNVTSNAECLSSQDPAFSGSSCKIEGYYDCKWTECQQYGTCNILTSNAFGYKCICRCKGYTYSKCDKNNKYKSSCCLEYKCEGGRCDSKYYDGCPTDRNFSETLSCGKAESYPNCPASKSSCKTSASCSGKCFNESSATRNGTISTHEYLGGEGGAAPDKVWLASKIENNAYSIETKSGGGNGSNGNDGTDDYRSGCPKLGDYASNMPTSGHQGATKGLVLQGRGDSAYSIGGTGGTICIQPGISYSISVGSETPQIVETTDSESAIDIYNRFKSALAHYAGIEVSELKFIDFTKYKLDEEWLKKACSDSYKCGMDGTKGSISVTCKDIDKNNINNQNCGGYIDSSGNKYVKYGEKSKSGEDYKESLYAEVTLKGNNAWVERSSKGNDKNYTYGDYSTGYRSFSGIGTKTGNYNNEYTWYAPYATRKFQYGEAGSPGEYKTIKIQRIDITSSNKDPEEQYLNIVIGKGGRWGQDNQMSEGKYTDCFDNKTINNNCAVLNGENTTITTSNEGNLLNLKGGRYGNSNRTTGEFLLCNIYDSSCERKERSVLQDGASDLKNIAGSRLSGFEKLDYLVGRIRTVFGILIGSNDNLSELQYGAGGAGAETYATEEQSVVYTGRFVVNESEDTIHNGNYCRNTSGKFGLCKSEDYRYVYTDYIVEGLSNKRINTSIKNINIPQELATSLANYTSGNLSNKSRNEEYHKAILDFYKAKNKENKEKSQSKYIIEDEDGNEIKYYAGLNGNNGAVIITW